MAVKLSLLAKLSSLIRTMDGCLLRRASSQQLSAGALQKVEATKAMLLRLALYVQSRNTLLY